MTDTEIPTGPVEKEPTGFAVSEAQETALRDTLTAAGVSLGAYDDVVIEWLSRWDWSTVSTITSWACRATAPAASAPVALPGRFDATPAEVDRHLRRILADDIYLRYQQTIGGLAVEEAARDVRMTVRPDMDATEQRLRLACADTIDPLRKGGRYPSQRLCSQHNGFGPCPGTPDCKPREDAQ
ncbi:hypothetical protein ACFZC3_15310 [Streptomyces sp. NPDC007903]|uniref:hypothetical protein n=1 Tax=Streptomyces sp. NPDC007903 TaxID=3364786 RepID=UPI0036E3689E